MATPLDQDLRDVKQEPLGSLVFITYADGKKQKSMNHKLADADDASRFVVVLDCIRKAQQGVSTVPVPPVRLLRAVALFPLVSSDPEVLSLVRGQGYTLLDQVGNGTWFYGYGLLSHAFSFSSNQSTHMHSDSCVF